MHTYDSMLKDIIDLKVTVGRALPINDNYVINIDIIARLITINHFKKKYR